MCELYGKNRWLEDEIKKATKQNARDKAGLLRQYRIRKYKFGRQKMADKSKFKVGDEVKQIRSGGGHSAGFYGNDKGSDPYMCRRAEDGGATIFTVTNSKRSNLWKGTSTKVLLDITLKGDDGSLYFADSGILELVTPPAPEPELHVTVVHEDGTHRLWSMSTVREALRKHAE